MTGGETVGPAPRSTGRGQPAGGTSAAIGQRRLRVEDPKLLTGRGAYASDLDLPRLRHVAFLRSPLAHARIVSIDTSRALEVPGVEAVLTGRDLPDVRLVDGNKIPGLRKTPQPVLATTRVRFAGEALAVVVATDRYAAEDALDVIDVDYAELPPVTSVDQPRPAGHVALCDDIPDDVVFREHQVRGDVTKAFASAAHVVASTYRSARQAAAPMEGRACVAAFEPASRLLSYWSSTQSPHLLRRKLSLCTGLPEHQIRVFMPDVGGAFGQKIPVSPEEVVVALVAMKLGGAVKWVEDRRENLLAAPHARDHVIRLELALAADGTFLGFRADLRGDAGAYSYNCSSALVEPFLGAKLIPGPYHVRDFEYEVVAALTNKSPIAPYRGVGWQAAQTAREVLIDRAARVLGRDPVDLRLQNMIASDAFPYTSATGLIYDSGSYRESLELAAEKIEYAEFRRLQRETRRWGGMLGIGFSPYVEPTGWGTAGMEQIGFRSFPSNDSARASMDASGKVSLFVGTVGIGQGHDTAMAQIAADILGIDPDDVAVVFSDTSSVPISVAGTRASRSTVVGGGAVGNAARRLRDKLLRVAGAVLEISPADLEISAGRVRPKGVPAVSMSVREVAEAAFYDVRVRAVEPEPDLSCTSFHDPGVTYSNGCVAAVVEVDPGTGAVRIRRLIGVEDCGTVVNPMLVEGQFIGGTAQGVGGALLEQVVYDEQGQPLTSTLMDYLLPSATEMTDVEVAHLSSPSPNSWRGIKGMAESGTIGAPAAIANAVADALAPYGAEITSTPITPEAVIRFMHPDL